MAVARNVFGIGNFIQISRNFLASRLYVPAVTQCVGLKTEEKHLKLPEKPKKPLTPYFRFLAQVRPSLKQGNPNAAVTEIVRLSALKWDKADPKLKSQLEEDYKKDHAVYVKAKLEYEKKLTNEQREEIKEHRQLQAISKEKRSLKKKMRELGRPKKPSGPFLRFLVDEQPRSQGNLSFRDWQVKAAQMWAVLNPIEKKVLQDKCTKDMEQYKKELLIWEEKMISAGHIDVVRAESLIEPALHKKTQKASSSKPKSKE